MSTPGARAFPVNWWMRAGWVALAAYVVYASARLDFTWERFVVGLGNGARFIDRMIPPVIMQPDSLANGLLESLQIALVPPMSGPAKGQLTISWGKLHLSTEWAAR